MKLFPSRRSVTSESGDDGADAPVALTESYTNGGALASTASVWVMRIVVVVACLGAFLAAWLVFRPQAPKLSAPAPAVSQQQPVLTQSAGSYAVGFVGTWLSATRDDSAALQGYVSTVPASLGDRGTDYRNLAVASLTEIDGTSDVLVIVSGEVLERATAEEDPTWLLRYYSVTISTEEETLAAAGFPALVDGPIRSTRTVEDEFPVTVNATSPAAQTVSLFLTAYLTGQGSTTPYLSPGVSIAPITPVPYKMLAVAATKAVEDPALDPADGATALIEMTVTLQADVDQSVTSTYRVSITARAGRWEITSLNSATPARDEADAEVVPAPTTTPLPAPITTPSPSDG